jgi:hypothetical protein
MLPLLPPYRKRIYRSQLSKDEIKERIKQEFVSYITTGKFGIDSAEANIEPNDDEPIRLWMYVYRGELVGELSFINDTEMEVKYAPSPIRQAVALLFLIVAVSAILVFDGGTFALCMIFMSYFIMVFLLSLDVIFMGSNPIEKFIKTRLLV